MNFYKLRTSVFFIIFIICLTFFNCTTSFATNFKDVNEDYWAYSEIQQISSFEILVGDLSGNFNPESYIDKFEFAKVLTRLASVCSYENFDEKQTYSEQYKDIVNEYKKIFEKWNSTADPEIALLLENQIFTQYDLDLFIIKDKSNKEQIKALTREELAVFLVRLMGAENKVNELEFKYNLQDDYIINQDIKNHIYYIISTEIMQANDGYFNPKKLVTKAELSSILSKYLDYVTNSKLSEASTYENTTFTGTVKKVYPEANTILININETDTFYKFSNQVYTKLKIYNTNINEALENKTIYFSINKENFEINEISLDENLKRSLTNYATSEYTIYKNIFGYVKNITKDSITLEYRTVLEDEISELKTEEFIFSETLEITKNYDEIAFSEIKVGDIFNAKVIDNIIYNLNIENEKLNLKGSIVLKNIQENGNSIIIKSDDDNFYEIYQKENLSLLRNDEKVLDFSSFKIGDIIEVENSQKISATSYYDIKYGTLTSIKISNTLPEVTINTLGQNYTYFIKYSDLIKYNININDEIILILDSLEIVSIKNKE